jgi:hypothetical protein
MHPHPIDHLNYSATILVIVPGATSDAVTDHLCYLSHVTLPAPKALLSTEVNSLYLQMTSLELEGRIEVVIPRRRRSAQLT